MKESYGEGIASHTGPESCLDDPRGRGEALTGESAGGLLSSENTKAGRVHNPIGARPDRKCKSQVKVRYSHALSNDSGFRCTCTFDLSPSLLTVSDHAQIILFFIAGACD